MRIQKVSGHQLWTVFVLSTTVGLMAVARPAIGQNPNQPWMNSKLSPENRAELVLKQMTLEEKIALLHGNGMAHAQVPGQLCSRSFWGRSCHDSRLKKSAAVYVSPDPEPEPVCQGNFSKSGVRSRRRRLKMAVPSVA